MNQPLLARAQEAWQSLAPFREDRQRNKRYTYGRQWDDRILVDGQWMKEEDYIRSQGSVPLKNNLIRRLVRNVLGVWRTDFSLPRARAVDPAEQPLADLANTLLAANAETNRLAEVYARTMEEFLIGGLAVHRKSYAPLGGRPDCRTDYVHPDSFFFRTEGHDFRGWDISLAGQFHEVSFAEAAMRFVRSPKDLDRLSALFPSRGRERDERLRIAEVWEEDAILFRCWHDPLTGRRVRVPADSARRPPAGVRSSLRARRQWRFSFLGPEGEVLLTGPSPYPSGRHPYVVKAYPFVDGEVHSFVGDVIDQQRYTNRLITLYDWIMRASAKGVLLFPEEALPDGAELNEIAAEWSRFNGVLLYRGRNSGGQVPQQVSSNATNVGITELLDIQMRMFEEISGVSSALQGKLESSTVSGTLFNQQTQNALTSLRDLLESFREFVIEATRIDADNLLHFYTPRRLAAIAGRHGLPLPPDPTRFRRPALDFIF